MQSPTIGKLGERLSVTAVVITIIGFGYVLGKDSNEGLAAFLREKNVTVEDSAKSLRAENEVLKM